MASISGWIEKISKHEAWEVAKPWVSTYALKYGVKSFYDVPEYFREKLELKGLKIGSKEFAGGLSGATADVLEKSQASKTGEKSRQKLYSRLTNLEESGQTETEEYKQIQAKLDETRSTAVKDAIAKVNKKLALTKEGEVKNSEARKEMARILREQRKAKEVNREALKKEVNTVLDDYTKQKVDGVTATREALRTVLTVSGQRHLMLAGHVLLDGASFVQGAAQKARREGQEVNAAFLKEQFVENTRQQWAELKSSLTAQNEDRLMSVGESAAQLEGQASKYINTGALREVSRNAIPIISNARVAFKKIGSRGKRPAPETRAPAPEPPPKYSVAPETKTGLAFTPEPKAEPAKSAPGASAPEPSSQQKITSADRSGLLSDGSAPTSSGATIDEQFAESYSQRASIKPSVGGISRPTNVKVDPKNPFARRDAQGRVVDPKRRRADTTSQVVVVPNKKTAGKAGAEVDPQEQREQLAAKEAVVTGARTGSYRKSEGKLKKPRVWSSKAKKKIYAQKLAREKRRRARARVKAMRVNSTIMAWVVPSYFFIQLPFAILNLTFLAMSYLVSNLTTSDDSTINEETGALETVTNFLWKGAKVIVGAFNSTIEFFTGLDILGFVNDIPQGAYLITVAVLLGYAMFTMLTMGIMYLVNGLKPLSGKGSTSKAIAFMFCLFGYFAPFFNLFPWVVIWATAVWKNPK